MLGYSSQGYPNEKKINGRSKSDIGVSRLVVKMHMRAGMRAAMFLACALVELK